jgi:hypothetical protein
MATTAEIRLNTAIPQTIGTSNVSPLVIATTINTIPKQPLINKIEAVIDANALKIGGIF